MTELLLVLTRLRLRQLPLLVFLVAALGVQQRGLEGQAGPPHTLYFAEGATGFFTTSIDLLNPSATDTANATVTFVGSAGPVGTKAISLAPGTSQSISLNTDIGAIGGYATIVESNIELFGERHMSWGEGGYGSSLERGVRHTSTTWYFAEGATGVFDLYYLLLNPGATAADVTITFLREVQEPITKQVTVPAQSRLTVRLMDFPELQVAALGAAITSTVPIVAEQAMYVSTESQFYAAGSASAATPTLATTVHFAEGATGLFFDEFLLLVNPSATPATATILYRLPDGTTLSKAYVIDPQRRRTIWLNYEAHSDPALAALASTAVGATVTSDIPIAVARKMYWPGLLLGGWGEASDAAGATTTTLSAFIGGGLVGGPDQAAMFLLVLNTSADAGHVQVTVTPQTGSPVALTYPIAGNARLTVSLADFGIVDQRFSVAIESLASSPAVPLVVEVSSYTSPGGQFWAAGSASAASVPDIPVGDTAPTVTATTPATGATNVAVDGNLEVTFSEPVNAGAGAFTLTCGATAVTLTNLTASPATTFSLDPATDLPLASSCTLTVVASEISDADTDDPPDTPTADTTVTFTTSTCAAITVSPTTVPGGTVTLPYGPVTFTQTGGTTPITWSVTTGTLPAGLLLDSATGVLSGTPTASGPFAFTVTATDTNACTGAVPLSLSILSGPNQAPSFVAGPAVTALEDAGAHTLVGWATNISPGPADEAAQVVSFAVTGNTNPALFTSAPAVTSAGVLTFTTAANINGSATITLVAQDNGGTALGGVDTSAPQSFTITVTPVNDAPSFTKGADQTSLENAGPQTVAGWATALSAGPADEAGQLLNFVVTGNTNPALFSAAPAVASNGTLTYTAAANAAGTADISVALQDSGGTAAGGVNQSPPQTFTITITGINTAPSFTVGPDQTVGEDSGPQTVAAWATAISPGPGDEAAQTIAFNVTGNTNPALFTAAPAVAPDGTLTYTTTANTAGTATITLLAQDNGGTANGGVDTTAPQSFTITVTSVNDPPGFVPGASPSSAEDAGGQTVPSWATSIVPGPFDELAQTVTFVVTGNTNPALFSAAPAVSPTGTLTYTSAPNGFGTADITIVLQDNGGTANGGNNTSAPYTFTITVTSVNDPPALTTPIIAFATVGNTQLHVAGAALPGVVSIADASGILTKSVPVDSDGPAALTVVPFTGATTNGSVTLNADGSFTYVPNAGFTGGDSFAFQVTDSVTPVGGMVNVTVSNIVWYVNNETGPNNAAGGDGRSTDAFETLAAAQTASGDNHTIFVFNGASTTTPLAGGIALKNGQKLLGEGVGLTFAGFAPLVPAGTQPKIAGAAAAVTATANAANGDRTGLEIRGLDVASTGAIAIDVRSANTQNLGARISENTVTNGTKGIFVNQGSTGTATLNVQANTITAAGNGLELSRTAGAMLVTAFNDNIVTGNTTGIGIAVSGPVTFDATPGGTLDPVGGGTTRVGVAGNGVGSAGVLMNGVTGAIDFVDLDVFNDTDVGVTFGGTGQFTGAAGARITAAPGAAVVSSAAGAALNIADATLDLQFGGLTSTNSTSNGVTLTNVGGTLAASSTASLTNATGIDFNIIGGTANVTYNGTITDDVGVLVQVLNSTGGTKSFTGAITDGNDGDGSGIVLTSNPGTTIAFSGGLLLSTGANPAFTATSGGTVSVCDENPCNAATTGSLVNSLTTTTGTALSVINTTIGAGGLEFQSISANGAATGISVNNTGTVGGLKVKGTGTIGSGGTIQNITNRGISLASTAGVDLNWMNLTNAATTNGADPTNSASGCGELQTGGNLSCNAPIHLASISGISGGAGANLNRLNITNSAQVGINLNSVAGLTISNVTMSGIGNQTREYGVKGRNVTGTVTISALSITGSFGDNFRVENNTGTSNVTVSGGTFNNSTEGNGFLYMAQGAAQTSLSMSTTTIMGNFATGLFAGVPDPAATGTANVIVTGGTYANNNAGIQVIQSGGADVTFSITGAGISGNPAAGIALDMSDQATAAGSLIGTMSGNTITQPASGAGNGIFTSARGAGTTTLRVANNTIQNRTQYGIHLHRKEGLNGTMNVTVTSNTVTTFDTAADTFFPIDSIRVEAGAASADTGTVCANISGNTATGAGSVPAEAPGDDIRLRMRFAHTFQLPGLVGTDATAAINLLNTNNPASGSIQATTTTAFATAGSCPTPP